MSVDELDNDLDFQQARFPIELDLPNCDGFIEDARSAVRCEFRDSVKWKRLQCRNVKLFSESESGNIYELTIGHLIEFDWTWEGAIAFRPVVLKECEEHQEAFVDNCYDAPEIDDSIVWSGEVLEVDEATGRIFIVVSNPEYPPRQGSFYIRPFEFLAFLNSVYNDPQFAPIRESLSNRLSATRGNIHPDVKRCREVGLPELLHCWEKSWSVLWGPPGTGKTYTTGQQVAQVIRDRSERILVISTTNRATDAAAIAIGNAAKAVAAGDLRAGRLLRIGKGGSLERFQAAELTDMLRGTETEYLARIDQLFDALKGATLPEEKALLRKQIKDLRSEMQDAAQRNFLDDEIRVVISTAFRATTFLSRSEVKEGLEKGTAPFTTIFIDEAGLMSRAAVAALSLLASRRVTLVGDSKQLAPISRISRILPPSQGNWLASSGLSHLDDIKASLAGVHVLKEQRRMHADVCEVVSSYQYDGFLETAPEVRRRGYDLPKILVGQPRAIWYVLDDDCEDLPSIRAERGPGNRSWIRDATPRILERLLSDPTLRAARGMFISPFKAQAKEIDSYFANNSCHTWTASTVHSQQGSEADIVIFDSVNAGSYSWPYDEWKRLVNVALSRSREAIIVLSSRAEMNEPYLRPLLRQLAPRVLQGRGGKYTWVEVPVRTAFALPTGKPDANPFSLGSQLAKRKELRPVFSQEQQRLCGFELDGKPRLVRGVAGSGKTAVLAHWLMQTVKRLQDAPDARIWAMFANRSLQSLISESIESAWEQETGAKAFPWNRVSLYHVREILAVLLREVGLSMDSFGFEYDDASAAYLAKMPVAKVTPRCDAMFIDEAQDMGPNTLMLLSAIVQQTDKQDDNSRSVNIFYDNAQNIYDRGTPTWSELGLDMRGRSTVMKESFRSTKPITEFALNVLYRLQPPDDNPDHKELAKRGLIESTKRCGSEWWTVRFNQIDGPKPEFRQFMNLEMEFEAIGDYCHHLIAKDGVQPSDICLLYNGANIRYWLESKVAPRLRDLGVTLSIQANKPFQRTGNIVLATTSHSFKGYDAEVVIVPAVDQYKAKGRGILANNLYVAMTRARSVLTLFSQKMANQEAITIYRVIEECLDCLTERPKVDSEISPQDDLYDTLGVIGTEHRAWLTTVWSQFAVSQEPLMSKNGEIVAEPLFWFESGGHKHACFGRETPRQRVLQRLEDFGVKLLEVGQDPP